MKLERIETPDYILAVSDEKPTVGNQFIYETDTQTINTTCSDYTPNEFDFIIKAYQPKGNVPELDLPLLPEIVVEDDVEKLCWRLFGGSFEARGVESEEEADRTVSFGIECHKAATKVYTEKDLKMMFAYAHQVGMNSILQIQSPHLLEKQDTNKLRDEFIQSFKQPKTPKWFVAETEDIFHSLSPIGMSVDTVLKTTTTNGKTYLVGKYE